MFTYVTLVKIGTILGRGWDQNFDWVWLTMLYCMLKSQGL